MKLNDMLYDLLDLAKQENEPNRYVHSEEYDRLFNELDNKTLIIDMLEEQLGCPLEVFLDLFIHNKPFYYEDENKKIHLIERYEFYNNNLIIFGRYNGCSVYLKDYKKTWWLKEDKTE